jgi:hypothetical protein
MSLKRFERVRGIAQFRLSVENEARAKRHAQDKQPQRLQFFEKLHSVRLPPRAILAELPAQIFRGFSEISPVGK